MHRGKSFNIASNHSFSKRLSRCCSGAVSPLVALMLIPILGATALAVDVGYWYHVQRSMQNAADAAALAGAQTPDDATDSYKQMAVGTAAKFGFTDGSGSVTVSPSRVICPSGTGTCTQVVIGYTSPLFFAPVVGFLGNKNGGSGQGISALAVAGQPNGSTNYQVCLMTLDSNLSEPGITAHGVPFADLNGCSIYSSNNLSCTGGNLGAGVAAAYGNSSNCGTDQQSNYRPALTDPYSGLASNIPTNPCSNYPQASKSGNSVTVASSNQISGTQTWSGTKTFCGDVVLTGNANVSNTNLVIFNGRLITQGYTFDGSDTSLIFSGDPSNTSYYHYPTDTIGGSNVTGATISISAPSDPSNPWQGIAIYQDPALTTNVDIAQFGNSPTINVTGVIYLPNADVGLSGTINKYGTGYNCTVIVSYTMTINGTGNIFKPGSMSECPQAGVTPPTLSGGGGQPWLVK